MGKKTKIFGQCHICGRNGYLSFEHVPPQKAFNNQKVFTSKGTDYFGREQLLPWDPTGIKTHQHQGGMGEHTLCEKCNSDTGGWYGGAFVDFVHKGVRSFINKPIKNKDIIEVRFSDIRPLNIIKQIITMFFSVNSSSYSSFHPGLKDFVLFKNKKYIDPYRYKIQIFIHIGDMARHVGVAGVIDLAKQTTHVFTEISWPPFGYIISFDSKTPQNYCDITYFANHFTLEEKRNIVLKIPVLESNTGLPGDHRSKQDILKTGEMDSNYMYLLNDGHDKTTNLKN